MSCHDGCSFLEHCDLTIVCVWCVVSSSVEVFIRNKYVRKLYAVTGEQSKKPEEDKPKVGMNGCREEPTSVKEGGISMSVCGWGH